MRLEGDSVLWSASLIPRRRNPPESTGVETVLVSSEHLGSISAVKAAPSDLPLSHSFQASGEMCAQALKYLSMSLLFCMFHLVVSWNDSPAHFFKRVFQVWILYFLLWLYFSCGEASVTVRMYVCVLVTAFLLLLLLLLEVLLSSGKTTLHDGVSGSQKYQ